jgi:Cu-Zn family superoxide dismutase
MNTLHSRRVLASIAATASLAGCGAMHHGGMMAGGPAAAATLVSTQGSAAAGTVRFEQHGPHLMVVARVTGLKPNQEHGFHVHEKGDCTSPDAMSAGGHFNPGGKPHGQHGSSERHAGDLPNLRADAAGVAEARFQVDGLTIGSGTADIVGRSVVVHAGPDDYRSQPAGNSGPRIACAVIARS